MKILKSTLIVSALFLTACNSKKETIAIFQINEHPALTETRRGIIDAIKPKNHQYFCAQGNMTLAYQIAQKLKNYKMIVAIGSVAAQLTKNNTMVYASVTDPKSAGLEGNVGVSNFVPIEPQISKFKELSPKLKTLGMVYSLKEPFSQFLVEKTKEACDKNDISFTAIAVNNIADIQSACKKLEEKSDALYISNDNFLLSAIVAVKKAYKKPIFVSDTDIVKARNAEAALGPNQYQVGFQAGEMVNRILNGEKGAQEFPKKMELVTNDD